MVRVSGVVWERFPQDTNRILPAMGQLNMDLPVCTFRAVIPQSVLTDPSGQVGLKVSLTCAMRLHGYILGTRAHGAG